MQNKVVITISNCKVLLWWAKWEELNKSQVILEDVPYLLFFFWGTWIFFPMDLIWEIQGSCISGSLCDFPGTTSQLPLILHTHTHTHTHIHLLLSGWQSLSLAQASPPSAGSCIQERWPSSTDHRVNHDWSGSILVVVVLLTMTDLGWTCQPFLASGTWEKVS